MRGKTSGRYTPRRRGRDKDDGDARWLTTYGDAVTLLMAFFVMLYAMSQIDVVKFEAFVRGLEVPFGNPAASEGILERSNAIVSEATVEASSFETAVAPDPVRLVEPPRPAAPAPDDKADPDDKPDPDDEPPEPPEPQEPPPPAEEATPHIDLEQLERVREAVESSLAGTGLSHVVTYRLEERGLAVSIAADDVLFDTGSTVINPGGRRIVAAIAQPLTQFDNDVLVEGHTDNVPLNRNGYTNWNLSTDRAVAVLSLLAAEHRIDQRRLGAVGYGEFRPLVPNDSAPNRSLNRRVDVLVVGKGV